MLKVALASDSSVQLKYKKVYFAVKPSQLAVINNYKYVLNYILIGVLYLRHNVTVRMETFQTINQILTSPSNNVKLIRLL